MDVQKNKVVEQSLEDGEAKKQIQGSKNQIPQLSTESQKNAFDDRKKEE